MDRKQDVEKARYWQVTIREGARSRLSIREFCRRRKLNVSQFYWWQRRLKESRQQRKTRKPTTASEQASFVLVSKNEESLAAGIELVLGDGRRLRISRGVDEETLRAVLAAMEN
jgi:transposase-like protein